jgi:hypothetical protein
MGLEADFFVATPEGVAEFLKVADESYPTEGGRFPGAEYKGFTPLELGFLWAILCDEKWNVKKHFPREVWCSADNERYLFVFPDDFTKLIATLTDQDDVRVTDRWAQHEEIQGDADDLKPVLRDLRRLAALARNSGQNVYQWGSL